jgi:hypothetical protein
MGSLRKPIRAFPLNGSTSMRPMHAHSAACLHPQSPMQRATVSSHEAAEHASATWSRSFARPCRTHRPASQFRTLHTSASSMLAVSRRVRPLLKRRALSLPATVSGSRSGRRRTSQVVPTGSRSRISQRSRLD